MAAGLKFVHVRQTQQSSYDQTPFDSQALALHSCGLSFYLYRKVKLADRDFFFFALMTNLRMIQYFHRCLFWSLLTQSSFSMN